MVIISCTYCGNTDLKRGQYFATFRCTICERDLELYQTNLKHVEKEELVEISRQKELQIVAQ